MTFSELEIGQRFRFDNGTWIWIKTKDYYCEHVGGLAWQKGNCEPDVLVKVVRYQFAPKMTTFGDLAVGSWFYYYHGLRCHKVTENKVQIYGPRGISTTECWRLDCLIIKAKTPYLLKP